MKKKLLWIGFCLVLASSAIFLQKQDVLQSLASMDSFTRSHGDNLKRLKKLSVACEKAHPFVQSSIPIDILIPVIEKDLDVLEHTIVFARRHVMHPIGNIYIVAPDREVIRACAERLGCVFVNEADVLPIQFQDIDYYPEGQDRRGWLFQQLLKLSADTIGISEHVLILDADTLLIRPQSFACKGRTIFHCADEMHMPYRKMYQRLIGADVKGVFSFVSHHMLMERSKLQHLKHHIESVHNVPWFQAILNLIDRQEGSGFSEYETYAQFVLENYPDEFLQLYFFNRALSKKTKLMPFLRGDISLRDHELVKSVSFHDYLD